MSLEKKIYIHPNPHTVRLKDVSEWLVIEEVVATDELSELVPTWNCIRYCLFNEQITTPKRNEGVGLEVLLMLVRQTPVGHIFMTTQVYEKLAEEFKKPVVPTVSLISEFVPGRKSTGCYGG